MIGHRVQQVMASRVASGHSSIQRGCLSRFWIDRWTLMSMEKKEEKKEKKRIALW